MLPKKRCDNRHLKKCRCFCRRPREILVDSAALAIVSVSISVIAVSLEISNYLAIHTREVAIVRQIVVMGALIFATVALMIDTIDEAEESEVNGAVPE